jgi:predicted negative regulator of RcsB-dependent stress response
MTENQKQDDRNLVEASHSVEGSFEDNLATIWTTHYLKIIGGVFLLFIAVTGYNVVKIMEASNLEEVQAAYLETLANEEGRIAFGESHPNHPLGGVVFYKEGVKAMADSDYAKATDLFGKASNAFKGTVMEAKTKLSLAVAQIEGGNETAGVSTLESIVKYQNAYKTFKGEAYLKLLIVAIKNNKSDLIDRYFEEMNAIEGIDQILARAHSIRDQFQGKI